ncbi:MAG: ATP-dependent helicase [Mesorhizobium sp.]|nr:MAG: ATP-dependent helicase [Mesorhizobium sp.]
MIPTLSGGRSNAITSPTDREAVAGLLFEIASVDERMDKREAELLGAMRNVWGVTVSFLNRPIVWDEDQQLVIEAKPNDYILVSAGPGMGKTAVACSRVAYLVDEEDVADGNIWLVSFTRAAIAEIKARIGDFAEDPSNVFAVKISTIDSQAWKIRYGFSAEVADKLFGGFDTGINTAIDLMDEREDDFRDAFGDLEHLIIDEAQDITGPRARFLLKLIELLPPSCGLTVFHDPAQAIYDYAESEADRLRFTDALREVLGSKLQGYSLKRIYRTNEPALLKLYEDLRLDILGNADVSPADFKAKADMVRSAAGPQQGKQFDHSALAGYDDALVLFRRRIEVAQASAFMASKGKAHRLRMSGLPRLLQPWLALSLGDSSARYIEETDFLAIMDRLEESVPAEFLRASSAVGSAAERWQQLRRYATAGSDRVDLHVLRGRLAAAPPDEFMMTECGHAGPILGTIHASKGREADHVVLQINSTWGSGEGEGNLAEESRVLFVGATRAKRSLSVQGGFAMPFASSTEGGRCYRAMMKYRTGYQVQVGLTGDYDLMSAARLGLSAADLGPWQTPFGCTADLDKASWTYRLSDAGGTDLGRLTKALNNDLFEIGRRYPKRGRKPPEQIRNLFVLGFGTAVAAAGDDRLASIAGRAGTSGFWLAPQIVGLPMVFLGW